MQSLQRFKNLYKLSKTIQFELIPQFETEENIIRKNIIDKEKAFAAYCSVVKGMIDQLHREAIEDSMSRSAIDWAPLAEALASGDRAAVSDAQAGYRAQIAGLLEEHPSYAALTAATPENLIKNELTQKYGEDNDTIVAMDKRALALSDYQTVRTHLYSRDEKHSTVAYRLVHENFPIFLHGVQVYAMVSEAIPDIDIRIQEELKDILNGESLDSFFDVSAYNRFLTQTGITLYNTVIGGYSDDEVKHRGLNEIVNLWMQEDPAHGRLPKFPTLKKMPLAETVSFSFVSSAINSDRELCDVLDDEVRALLENEVFHDAAGCVDDVRNGGYDLHEVFITRAALRGVSNNVFKNWSRADKLILDAAAAKKKTGKLTKAETEKITKARSFDLATVVEALGPSFGDDSSAALSAVLGDFDHVDLKARACLSDLSNTVEDIRGKVGDAKWSVRTDDSAVDTLKFSLDKVVEVIGTMRGLYVKEQAETDFAFDYYPLVDAMRSFSRVYDRIRNYVTKKPFSTQKYAVTFENPSFGGGFSQPDVKASIIARHEGRYYFIALAKEGLAKTARIFTAPSEGSDWERLDYKYISDAGKMIPKCMFSSKMDDRARELYPRYMQKLHVSHRVEGVKGFVPGDVEFARELITYFDTTLRHTNETFSKFSNLVVKPAEQYASWKEFTDDMTQQMYELTWVGMDSDAIREAVKEGSAFLFEIHSRDFDTSKGRKTMQALLFLDIMNDPNGSPFKLCSSASVFFRPASLTRTPVHKAGSTLVNRTATNGVPVPGNVYREMLGFFAGKYGKEGLSEEAKRWLPLIRTKKAERDIVKDRRYTRDQYSLNLAIECNWRANGRFNINEMAREWFRETPDAHVIGVNRGENNLVFVTVIDKDCRIVEQRSLNVINGFDYREKLRQIESLRQDERMSWKDVQNISNTKEGYVGGVIHEICSLIAKYNAVVAVEDLNVSFKQGRGAIESSVYQQFESQLVSKLQYMADKADIRGGVQLTAGEVALSELKDQQGFIFFVSPWAVSMTDPLTGFINLFKTRDISSQEAKRSFLSRFKSIRYGSHETVFELDYARMGEYAKDGASGEWKLTTRGKRLVVRRDTVHGVNTIEEAYANEIIYDALKEYGVEPEDGLSIVPLLEGRAGLKLAERVFEAFLVMMQTRNYRNGTGEDFFVCPALDGNGNHFDTYEAGSDMPQSTDAVSAYNIARKALIMLNRDDTGADGKRNRRTGVTADDWLEYLRG